ncbi:MAG: hypothetical protein RLZZ511_3608 [Cyanobacteriota bacterium]|jgi:hypothetical protein
MAKFRYGLALNALSVAFWRAFSSVDSDSIGERLLMGAIVHCELLHF